MRFMILRKADHDTESGALPTTELITAMLKYNEELVKAGRLVAGDGLHPSSKGARVKFSRGKPVVTDGPFAETRELIAGYTMIEAASLQEAIKIAKKWPPLDAGGQVELEIRQVIEAPDFGPALTPELERQEERLRAQSAAKK